jgi:hypothetical protein
MLISAPGGRHIDRIEGVGRGELADPTGRGVGVLGARPAKARPGQHTGTLPYHNQGMSSYDCMVLI